MFSDDKDAEGQSSGPSREVIEALCVVYAVGMDSIDGIGIDDLPARLGIAHAHAKALSEAIQPLVARGWISRDDQRVFVTEQGKEWAHTRLKEFGVG